jgi:hypothetical protein
VSHRRTVIGAVFAALLILIAGCGFESPDVSTTERADVQGGSLTTGAVVVRDAFITAATSTSPTMYLVVTFINNASTGDALTQVQSQNGTVTLGGQGVTGTFLKLPSEVPVEIVDPLLGTPGPTLTVSVFNPVGPGEFVPIVFHYSRAGQSQTLQVPIVPAGETTAPTQPVPTNQASVPTEPGESASD